MSYLSQASDSLRRLIRDPALLVSVGMIWALLGLFILFPLVWLLVRTFTEGGANTQAKSRTGGKVACPLPSVPTAPAVPPIRSALSCQIEKRPD